MDSNVTGDFIFGTLGTDERRLKYEQSLLEGIRHDSRVLPQDPAPGDCVRFAVTVGVDVAIDRIELLRTTDDSFPGEESEVFQFARARTEWSTLAWGYIEIWECEIEAQEAALWRYRIRATSPNGDVIWADPNPLTGQPGLFALSIDNEMQAEWLREAVIYHVFVDRFSPDGGEQFAPQETMMDFWGGTLKGITSHLDYIQQLGATAIWLSPISPSPTHHGYDVTDYKAIEPRLGTLADFDELVESAHARGIRVILDFVASHASNLNPAFQTALKDPGAPERQRFIIHDDSTYESFFGVESMPRINGDAEAGFQWMADAALYWADRGVDGFRLDYAIGQSLQFWTRLRHVLRSAHSHFALIGEAVDSARTLQQYRGRMDAVLDFLFLERVRKFVGFETESASDFWRFYERHATWFVNGPSTPTFLDNHDMNRFLWVVQGDTRRLKIAALLQFALPQPPIVYYGTEVGLSQLRDIEHPNGERRLEESRCPMIWGANQNRELLEFYRSLVHWRKRFAIANNSPKLVHAGEDGTLIFTSGEWLVVLNRNDEETTIDLGSRGTMWLGLATDNDVRMFGSELVLPPYSGVLVANQLAR